MSYDKKFHQFDYGEYFVVEDTAKENAFETACRKLDLMFPKELQEFIEQDTSSPSQRKFMDLRSTLGLTVRCLPEIKRDSHGQLTYAFNIEFCRGGVVEIVYGDFGPDEKNSKEKAFELATWRVKYLYGPELDLANNKPLLLPPHEPTKPLSKDPDISFVDWNPSNRKFYNPHYSGNMPSSIGQRTDKPSYAMVSPRVQQPETPVPAWSPLPDHTSHVEYNRTYEYRFKEITDILNVEYFLRKIPKFEGGHKIFAFEITFQGIRGNLSRQQSVGEYFRDEGMAKESAFKYACEQLNS
ncbi:unnamed protein product [Allacma fusca]|uniref:DRBM domain-containing protein n=1 Tax=Allacma fusca TaxID=39272 RepID=A0A8J2NYN8_9HEXA|nr:unnamed protein product [Allacma fusca]